MRCAAANNSDHVQPGEGQDRGPQHSGRSVWHRTCPQGHAGLILPRNTFSFRGPFIPFRSSKTVSAAVMHGVSEPQVS